jgi:di/tricarboxylate transporter
LALALEKVNLHKRIALNIVKLTGTSPNKVVLGFMIATAFMSMWISNTASTVVMLPIAISVIRLLIKDTGGLSLAKRMASSGLVALITDTIAAGNFPVLLKVSLLIVLMLFMTELRSNLALVAVLAPVVVGIVVGLNISILNLLIPVTMASSCAFMLPIATPPNAIIFASGYVKVNQMIRAGIVLNLIAVGLLILYYQFVIPLFVE